MNQSSEKDRKEKISGCHPVGVIKLQCSKNCERCREKKEKEGTDGTYLPKVVSSLLFFLFSITGAMAQDAKVMTFWDDPFNHPMLMTYLVIAFVFVTILLVLVVVFYLYRVLRVMMEQVEKERAIKLGKVYVPAPSWWETLWQRLNSTVPLSKEADIDLGHNFDGIRELDNHLPPWWKGLFYATIVWGVGYVLVYHVMDTRPLQLAEYENEVAAAQEPKRLYLASQPQESIDENTLVFTKNEAIIAKGKKVFMSNNCASCHRADGGGNSIGPNLTDEYWLHGGAIRNIFTTIKSGVVEKGMPAWGKVMSPQDVRDVTFYVMSLQGSKPANPKASQGDLFFEPASVDTVGVQAMIKP